MKQFIEFYRNPWIWGTHLIGALVAWFAPLDVLDQSAALRSFTDLMGGIFPTVVGYKKSSKFPQVSALYFSLMFVLGPIWFWKTLSISRRTVRQPSGKIWSLPRPLRVPVVLLLGGALFIGLPAFQLFFNPGYDLHVMPISSSRLSLGIWGPLHTTVPWMMFAEFFLVAKLAFKNSHPIGRQDVVKW